MTADKDFDEFSEATRILAAAIKELRQKFGYDDEHIADFLRFHADYFKKRAKRNREAE